MGTGRTNSAAPVTPMFTFWRQGPPCQQKTLAKLVWTVPQMSTMSLRGLSGRSRRGVTLAVPPREMST